MILLKHLYLCGRHRYTLAELADNLRACGFAVDGSEWNSAVTGPPDIMIDAEYSIVNNQFMGDWDGPSETGAPNWHKKDENGNPACACPACRAGTGVRAVGSKRLTCKLSAVERERLETAAKASGLTLNAWARSVLLEAAKPA